MFFSLPVLMYHSISRFKSGFCVPPESFDVHCKTLTDAGWRGISLLEAEDYFLKKRRLPRKTCLFTFDDGYLDNYVHAEPILRRYGHQGILFPVAECLNTESVLRPNADDLGATPDRAKELPDLDLRAGVKRAGALVSQTIFCSWREVVHMHHNGVLAAAPHSLRHDRVVRSLEYSNLCRPAGTRVFFTTERGANRRGGALSVRRISVRNWSSDLLMQKVSLAANAALEEPYGWWAKLYQTKAARQFRQYIRSRF